jgi:hypothetical protein
LQFGLEPLHFVSVPSAAVDSSLQPLLPPCTGALLVRTDICDPLSVNCHLQLPEDISLEANTALKGAGGALLITNFTRLEGKLFGCAVNGKVNSCLEQKASRRRLQGSLPAAAGSTLFHNNTAMAGYGNNIATAAARMVAMQQAGD